MADINIMMIGGRRCGKTSVLASMQNCFETVMATSALNISTGDYATLDVLEEKFREAEDFFRERNKKKRTFCPDANPTTEIMQYSFNIGMNGKKGDIKLNFIDYPGEFITNSEKRELIQQYMSKSRILVIAIDTPHMMEEDQKFDDLHNIEKRITEMIKNSEFASTDKGPGMVLFVPLKCERYRNDNRMGEVTAQVKKSYSALMNYIQSSNNNMTMAIAPIITFGGAAFSRFERDEEGEIKINQRYRVPEEAIYYFPDMTKDHPEPMYCEQPLLYILFFVLNEAAKNKMQRNWLMSIIGDLWDKMFDIPSLEEYMTQLDSVSKHIKTRDDGFYVCC